MFEWGIATMQQFEFASGGAYHPEGMGEWRVTLEVDRTFAPTHQLGDVINELDSCEFRFAKLCKIR